MGKTKSMEFILKFRIFVAIMIPILLFCFVFVLEFSRSHRYYLCRGSVINIVPRCYAKSNNAEYLENRNCSKLTQEIYSNNSHNWKIGNEKLIYIKYLNNIVNIKINDFEDNYNEPEIDKEIVFLVNRTNPSDVDRITSLDKFFNYIFYRC